MQRNRVLLAVGVAVVLCGVAFLVSQALKADLPAEEDNSANHSVASTPISAPLSAPVKAPTATTTFTHPDLPGFAISYPEDWTLSMKPFQVTDPGDFDSYYYGITKGVCDNGCMGVRLSKGDISLNMAFDLILDDGGTVCFEDPEYEPVGPGYRVRYPDDVRYVRNADHNFFVEHPGWRFFEPDGTTAQMKTYDMCIRGSGRLLTAPPAEELARGAGAILMEDPRVVGTPDAVTWETIDAMILSIQGIEDGRTAIAKPFVINYVSPVQDAVDPEIQAAIQQAFAGWQGRPPREGIFNVVSLSLRGQWALGTVVFDDADDTKHNPLSHSGSDHVIGLVLIKDDKRWLAATRNNEYARVLLNRIPDSELSPVAKTAFIGELNRAIDEMSLSVNGGNGLPRTYINEEWGYRIDMPADWQTEVLQNNTMPSANGGTLHTVYLSGQAVAPAMKVYIGAVPNGMGLTDWVEDRLYTYAESDLPQIVQNAQIDGRPAVVLQRCDPANFIDAYLIEDGKGYIISYYGDVIFNDWRRFMSSFHLDDEAGVADFSNNPIMVPFAHCEDTSGLKYQ
jgi:hypothetical protein